ncbi:MAG: DUF3261 domain-containing protein [Cellvibrionaceae bacterium]
MSNCINLLVKFYVVLFLGFFIVVLIGCVGVSSQKELPALPLLSPQEFGGSVQITQRVSIKSDSRSQTLLAAWAVSEEEISLVGLSPTGQRLVTLNYDGDLFTEEYSELLEERIPGITVFSYMQLAHWPEDSIRKALLSSLWDMKFSFNTRSLFYKKNHVLDINFSDINSVEKSGTAKGEAVQSLEPTLLRPSFWQSKYPQKIHIVSHVMPLVLDVETLNIIAADKQ